MRYFKLV